MQIPILDSNYLPLINALALYPASQFQIRYVATYKYSRHKPISIVVIGLGELRKQQK